MPAPATGEIYACRISDDGKTVDAMISNPYKSETSCQVNCQVSTTKAGTTLQTSCTKNVAPGGLTLNEKTQVHKAGWKRPVKKK